MLILLETRRRRNSQNSISSKEFRNKNLTTLWRLNFLSFLTILLTGIGHTEKFLLITAVTASPAENPVLSGGLINLGNTCYLNAQLECAYHIPKVRNSILEANPQESQNLGLLGMQTVFAAMYKASQCGKGNPNLSPSVSTKFLCQALGINVYEQQDAQEFWKLLLPELQHSALSQLYKGERESYITALDGSGREKKRQETFFDLGLDVTNFDNVHDSLEDMFTKGETLRVKDGNGWRPEKGAEKVDALKGYSLYNNGLPSILQLHLMRFKFDLISGNMSKINDRFIFPMELNLTSICHGVDNKKMIFDLQSVVVHAGEYGSGHYYSYIRPDVTIDRWYRYDDHHVTEVTFEMVQNDAFGGCIHTQEKQRRQRFWARFFLKNKVETFGWGGKSSCAYMLQYVKRSDLYALYNKI